MSIKVTNKVLVESKDAIAAFGSLNLPAKPLFMVTRAIRFVRTALGDFQEACNKLNARFGEKDETGKLKEADGRVKIADMQGYLKEIEALLLEEVTLDIRKVSAKALGDITFNGNMLAILDWLIDDDFVPDVPSTDVTKA